MLKLVFSKFLKIMTRIIFLPNFLNFIFSYLRFLKNPKRNNFGKAGSVAFRTNGKSLDIAHFMGRFKYRKFKNDFPQNNDLLGLTEEDFIQSRYNLHKFGYWIAPNPISPGKLDVFRNAAIENLYKSKGLIQNNIVIEELAKNLNQDMVNLDTQWVTEQELTLDFATSPEILRIAADYLGITPILNYPASWFSFPVEKIEKESAKNWHWDCDGIKWLKVFVYLNDVTLVNGPHAFVAGSHRDWKVNNKSSRVLEQEVIAAYGENAIKSFTAPKGTVIFEDTRGFHKGTPLLSGHRLVLQLQYNFDEFGMIKSKISLPTIYREKLQSYGRVLSFLGSAVD
jgi:hypothetical protein